MKTFAVHILLFALFASPMWRGADIQQLADAAATEVEQVEHVVFLKNYLIVTVL